MQNPQISPWAKDGATPFSNSQRKNCVSETRKIHVLENNEQTIGSAWRWTATGRTQNYSARVFSKLVEPRKCLREGWTSKSWGPKIGESVKIFPCHCEVKHCGGVCVWVRTDSPTTPLPKTINCLNHQQSFLMKVVGIKQRKKTHGFFSHWPRLTISPTSLSLWKSCPFRFSWRDRSWSGSFN